MSSPLAKLIHDTALELAPDVIDFRRDLHAHPELSNCEERTAAKAAEAMRALGLAPREKVGGHGVVALMAGDGEGPCVGARADMDALPITEETDLPFASTATAEWRGPRGGGHARLRPRRARGLSRGRRPSHPPHPGSHRHARLGEVPLPARRGRRGPRGNRGRPEVHPGGRRGGRSAPGRRLRPPRGSQQPGGPHRPLGRPEPRQRGRVPPHRAGHGQPRRLALVRRGSRGHGLAHRPGLADPVEPRGGHPRAPGRLGLLHPRRFGLQHPARDGDPRGHHPELLPRGAGPRVGEHAPHRQGHPGLGAHGLRRGTRLAPHPPHHRGV